MIGLPADKEPWPLAHHGKRYERMQRPAAWYSGDADTLRRAYGSGATVSLTGGPGTTLNPRGRASREVVSTSNDMWASRSNLEVDTRRHLPVAEDIARHSSRELFSERVKVRVDGPVRESDGPAGPDGKPQWSKGDTTPETDAAQRRLDDVLALCGFDNLLLAAAEISSALGSTGLRIAYDKAGPINDRPIISRVNADATMPVYRWGQLVGVMFWQVVRIARGGVVWRHIELHTGGKVLHGLYKGTGDNLGERRVLDEDPATAHLAPLVDKDGAVTILAGGGTTAVSIPNMLPDPLDLDNNAGRSDFTPAVMSLFDAIDRAFTQMMDAMEDAKSRLLIDRSLLSNKGAGKGQEFDQNQRIFTRVTLPPAERETGTMPIEKVQFEMHVAEYLQGIDWLVRQAVEKAGFNARGNGGEGGRDITATEVNSDNSLSRGTRDVKTRYWQPALQALLTSLLAVDVQQFAPVDRETGIRVEAWPVTVTFPDASQPTKLELANIAKALKEAGAASVYELVATVNPDWTDAQVAIEVERILTQAAVVDPVTFGLGGAGVGPGDGI